MPKEKGQNNFFANQSALIFRRDQYNQILRRTSVEMEYGADKNKAGLG